AIVFSSVAQAQENDFVLRTPNFNVVEQDLDYYMTERGIGESDAARLLSREGAVRNVFVNLYVIRAYANLAENNPAIDMEEVDWLTKSFRERLLMDRQIAAEIQQDLADTDWEAV